MRHIGRMPDPCPSRLHDRPSIERLARLGLEARKPVDIILGIVAIIVAIVLFAQLA